MKYPNNTDFSFDPDKHRTVKIPKWQYKLLRPYNGFTGIERIRGWQLTRWAINVGILRQPSICSISGEVGDYNVIQYHNENYYDPLAPRQIHKMLHRTLHQRFRNPDKWQMVVDRYIANSEDPWFAELPEQEPDLASALRRQGLDTERMVDIFVKNLPVGCPKPFGKLHTLEDFNDDGTKKRLRRVN